MAGMDTLQGFEETVVDNIPTSNWDDDNGDYEDGFEDEEDELFGTPPEYSYTDAIGGSGEGRYANLDEESTDNAKSYLDYNPGIFDDDAEGMPTPPDSGRSVPQFNTDEAREIASKLNNLIDSRSNSAAEQPSTITSAVVGNKENDSKGPATSPPDAAPDAVVAAGSALAAVRTRSGGSEQPSSHPFIDASMPSDKALRSYQQAMERGDTSKEDGSEANGGLTHRQTLRALKAKKESILAGKKQRPAGASSVVVEGEEPVGGGYRSDDKGKVRGGGRQGPAVRQIPRRKTAKELKAEAEEAAKEEETEEDKEKRRQAHKARKSRMAEMLANLQKAKAEEAEDKRKKEAAQKRRKAILTARVIAESNERTAMGKEDKPRYRALVLEKVKGKDDQAPATASVSGSRRKEKEAVDGLKKPPFGGGASSKRKEDKGESVTEAGEDADDQGDDSESEGGEGKAGKKGKISQTKSDALYSRLTTRQQKTSDGIDLAASQSVPVRDFADWKRKNCVPSEGLVFSMTGWYPCVKQALMDRGWYFNADVDSPYFDLKWTLRALQTAQETLQPWQLTNHFLKNMAITTKVGLLKSLRSLVWLADVSCNDVIPRGYDLSNDMEMQAFIDDYRLQHAEILLKKLYKEVVGISFPPRDIDGDYDGGEEPGDVDEDKDGEEEEGENGLGRVVAVEEVSGQDEMKSNFQMPITPRPKTPDSSRGSGGEVQINVAVFETCCDVLERYLRPTHDTYIDTEDDDSCFVHNRHAAMSGLQWEVLEGADMHMAYSIPDDAPEGIDAFLPGNEHMLQSQEEGGNTVNTAAIRSRKGAQDKLEANKSNAQLQRQARANERREKTLRSDMSCKALQVRAISNADISRMHRVLNHLYCHDRNQAGLNGSGDIAKNIWIVKPGAKSRGRGICTFADLPKLLKYVDAGTGSAQSSQWVVQKYMENPLCVANHKFDLRQWVLVTDWNPLTVWFYDECYARFSVEPYTTDDEALENSYVHLVNNSISKQSEEFKRQIPTESGENIQGFMWSHEQMSNWIKHQTGRDLMEDKIKPRMMDIAKWSLMCASECIEHRKNSWELYGFDFMVDDNYNTWLIEINSSPACDYSTPTTERYVQKALVELLSVTLDMREWENKSSKKRGQKPDTGGWSCIHKGPLLEMPTAAFGADISLKGDAMKLPKRKASYSGPPAQPFSNSAKRAAATSSSQKLQAQGLVQDAEGRLGAPSSPGAEKSNVPAPRVARTLRPAKLHASGGVTNEGEEQQYAAMGAMAAIDVNTSMEGSLMNDSVSLASLDNSMSMGTFDDSDGDSDAGKASRNVKKVLRAQAKAQMQAEVEAQAQAGYGSPLTQQLLAQRAQARNEAKFRLDPSTGGGGMGAASIPAPMGRHTQALTGVNINFTSPPVPGAPVGGGIENTSPGAGLAMMGTGGTLERERELTLQQRKQLKEIRAQKAASCKIVAVPPVGRDSAAIKAKVFELPF